MISDWNSTSYDPHSLSIPDQERGVLGSVQPEMFGMDLFNFIFEIQIKGKELLLLGWTSWLLLERNSSHWSCIFFPLKSFCHFILLLLLIGAAGATPPTLKDFHFLVCTLMPGRRHWSATFLCDMMKNRNGRKTTFTNSLKCVCTMDAVHTVWGRWFLFLGTLR